MKLRFKIQILTSLLIVLVVTSISGFLFIFERRFLVAESHDQQLNIMNGLAGVTEEYFINKEEIPLLNYINRTEGIHGVSYALVTDIKGKIIVHTNINLVMTSVADETGKRSLGIENILEQKYTNKRGNEILDIAVPVSVNRKPVGIARIGFSVKDIEASINKTLTATGKRILGVGLVVLLLGLIAALALARSIIKPIQRLERGAIAIGKGDLDGTIVVDSNDELGELARRFNIMSEQLKELDQMKSDFVSSVTHELRSPMTSIGLYLNLFFKGAAGPLNEKSKEFLEIIDRNVTRLRKFIDSLLDAAKLERGKMEIVPAPVNINSIFKEVESLFRPQAVENKISLELSSGKNTPDILADADRMIQILTNLTSNALKFTKPEGTISLTAKPDGNDMVLFSVKDTGIGIPPEDAERVFNKFEQVKKTKEQMGGVVKGTGLGLAIVKSLVELHKGRIWVESEPGKGTTFFFTIPRTK